MAIHGHGATGSAPGLYSRRSASCGHLLQAAQAEPPGKPSQMLDGFWGCSAEAGSTRSARSGEAGTWEVKARKAQC